MNKLHCIALSFLVASACVESEDALDGEVELGEHASELGLANRVAWGLGTYGTPTVFRGLDNRLQLVGTHPSSALVYDLEPSAGGWVTPYLTTVGSFALGANRFTAAQQADGKTVVFAVWNSVLYRTTQTAPYARTWTTWTTVGPAQNRQPSFARNLDGRLEGVYLGTDGKVKQLWQTAVNGGWSAPYDTGVLSSGTPEIARDPWNRLEIFAPVAGGSCGFRSWRQIDPNGWNGWYAPTVNGSLCVDNLAITYTGYNADVFLQTTTGAIYVTTRGAPVFPFNPPVFKYGAGTLQTTAAPLMVQKQNGTVYAFTGYAGFYRWVKRNSDASWYGFAILGASSATTPPPLAAATDADGQTYGFVVNSAGTGLDKVEIL